MRKILAVSIGVMLALSMLCVNALAAPDPNDILGIWYLNSLETEGMTLNPADFGMEMTMEFNADSTALLQSPGEEDMASTWAINGDQIVVSAEDGTDITLALIDGNLCGDMDEVKMVFGREKVEGASVEIAPVLTDSALADFNGSWIAFIAEADGIMLPIEMLGMEITAVINNGKATATMMGVDINLEGDVSDGVLTTVEIDADDEPTVIAFSLHEDGVMSAPLDESVIIYFNKAG